MKTKTLFAVGAGLILTAAWGDSYLMHIFGNDCWQAAPIFVTGLMLVMVGVALISRAIVG